MVVGTELCLSSSGGGHNWCLTGTVDSSGQSLNRCGGLLYGSTSLGRASIKRGHRGG